MLSWELIVTATIASAGWVGMAYEDYAIGMGLPRGAWSRSGRLARMQILTVIIVLLEAFKLGGFLGLLIVPIIAFLIAFILALLFRSWVQLWAVAGPFIAIAWDFWLGWLKMG